MPTKSVKTVTLDDLKQLSGDRAEPVAGERRTGESPKGGRRSTRSRC